MSNDTTIVTPWCFMPPEMHFDSPWELKEAVSLFQKSRLSHDELNCKYPSVLPPEGKFERIRVSSGKYILLPIAIDYAYLFRGQGRDYPKNLPTLYRQEKDEFELFIQHLKIMEFRNFLLHLPQLRFFESNNYHIDYVGLAQHYGLQTDMMDLTSDIDVALFFAMCDIPKGGTEYVCKVENKPYIGYIYCVPTYDFSMKHGKLGETFWGTKLSSIGLQPFERPGAQKGFAYRIENGEELKSLVYSFSYTRKDSETIFRKFSYGSTLWQDDALARIARKIDDSRQFSYNAFNSCVKVHGNKRLDYRTILKKGGYNLCNRPNYILPSEVQLIVDDYYKKGDLCYQSKITSREYRTESGIHKKCLSLNDITPMMMSHLIESGCPAPEGYETENSLEKDQKTQSIAINYTINSGRVQTHPDPVSGKVNKWIGDWRKDLKIDLNKEKQFGVKLVSGFLG